MLESLQTTQDNPTSNSIWYDLYIVRNSTVIITPISKGMGGWLRRNGQQLTHVQAATIEIRELEFRAVTSHIITYVFRSSGMI